MKVNSFTLELISTYKESVYLFINKLYKTVIYFLSINYYRSSLARLTNLPKKESSLRRFYFPTAQNLLLCFYSCSPALRSYLSLCLALGVGT